MLPGWLLGSWARMGKKQRDDKRAPKGATGQDEGDEKMRQVSDVWSLEEQWHGYLSGSGALPRPSGKEPQASSQHRPRLRARTNGYA